MKSKRKIKPLHEIQIDTNSILLMYVIGNDIMIDYFVLLTNSVLSSFNTNDMQFQQKAYLRQNLKSIVGKLRRQISIDIAKKYAKEKELYLHNQSRNLALT